MDKDEYIVADSLYRNFDLFLFKDTRLSKQHLTNLLPNLKILETTRDFPQRSNKGYFFAPFTCVELTKRILGIKKAGIITPYQLYKYLEAGNKCGNKELK